MATTSHQRGVEVHAVPSLAAPRVDEPSAWNAYYEDVYKDAAGELSRIPWGHGGASPALVAWLNREAPGMLRPGAHAIVVGCGLGDDVRELAERGFDPVGFDVSPTAVAWARQRFPSLTERFHVADVFSPPASMQRRADLVIEINTLQAIDPRLREKAAAGIVALARPRGVILAICRGRSPHEPAAETPPFAMTPAELSGLFERHGWKPTREVDNFEDDRSPPVRRLRAMFRREG